ncbi:hypothetical protein V5799_013545 [Amblyomma americanum]|uniref:Protein kinase domain-containing protein n=1 Tax=Amblyomma americanum TaxID=6943 RepID=A0AAQ4E5R4_AMBAM
MTEDLLKSQYVYHFLPRELAIIPKLQHPNIIRVYDILDIKRKAFVVMELATQGDLLLKITKDGRFSESKAFHYFDQICDAVAYLHRQNIVHRDLKQREQAQAAEPHVLRQRCVRCAQSDPEHPVPAQALRLVEPGRHPLVCGQLPFDDSNPFQQVRAQMSRQISFPPSYGLTKMCRNLIRHLLEAHVLYRCSVPRSMKHPWMRKERIKRKLKRDMLLNP